MTQTATRQRLDVYLPCNSSESLSSKATGGLSVTRKGPGKASEGFTAAEELRNEIGIAPALGECWMMETRSLPGLLGELLEFD